MKVNVPSIDDTSYVNPDVFNKFDNNKKKPTLLPTGHPSHSPGPARLVLTEPIKDFQVLEGNRAIFFCKCDANPTPEAQWLKDGQPLAASHRIKTSYNAGIATLIIDPTKTIDIGSYKCVVSNSVGTEESTANLEPGDYYSSIRSGDYYMFESEFEISDSDSDAENSDDNSCGGYDGQRKMSKKNGQLDKDNNG